MLTISLKVWAGQGREEPLPSLQCHREGQMHRTALARVEKGLYWEMWSVLSSKKTLTNDTNSFAGSDHSCLNYFSSQHGNGFPLFWRINILHAPQPCSSKAGAQGWAGSSARARASPISMQNPAWHPGWRGAATGVRHR